MSADPRIVAEAAKVAAWRRDNDLEMDEYFAYAWVSFDEALTDAGRPVAEAWARVRGIQAGGQGFSLRAAPIFKMEKDVAKPEVIRKRTDSAPLGVRQYRSGPVVGKPARYFAAPICPPRWSLT